MWARVPNGPWVWFSLNPVNCPVKMAANCGGGRALYADTVAVDEARTAAARNFKNEKDGEERMVLCQ